MLNFDKDNIPQDVIDVITPEHKKMKPEDQKKASKAAYAMFVWVGAMIE